MKNSLVCVLLLPATLFFLSLLPSSSAQCQTFHSDFCNDVISTYPGGLVHGSNLELTIVEAVLQGYGLQNVTILGPVLFPDCYDAGKRYICGNYFPQCVNGTEGLPVCNSICETAAQECQPYFASLGFNITCNDLPTTDCSTLQSYPPFNYSAVVCPSPLISNPQPNVSRTNCLSPSCCVPCPASVYFYGSGEVEVDTIVTQVFVGIFSSLCGSITVAYLLIPSKRKFPQSMIPAMAFTITLVMVSGWIGIYVGPKNLVCLSDVDQNQQGDFTPACLAQGAFLVYGVLSSLLWFGCITLNVFLVIFFRMDVSLPYQIAFHCASWLLPFVSLGLLFGFNQIGSASSPFCGVYSTAWTNGAVLIPGALVLFPSFILNLVILYRVYMLTRQTKKSFRAILKMQLRPLVFSTFATVIFITYWIYYFVGLDFDLSFVDEWAICIAYGNGQDECSKISKPYLPNYAGITVVFVLICTLGGVVFVLFGLKQDVIYGVYATITGTELTKAESSYAMTNKTQSMHQDDSNADIPKRKGEEI